MALRLGPKKSLLATLLSGGAALWVAATGLLSVSATACNPGGTVTKYGGPPPEVEAAKYGGPPPASSGSAGATADATSPSAAPTATPTAAAEPTSSTTSNAGPLVVKYGGPPPMPFAVKYGGPPPPQPPPAAKKYGGPPPGN